MTKPFYIDRLKNEFNTQQFFSRDSLFQFFISLEPQLNENTFRWRIHDLKEKHVINPVSKDQFTLASKSIFKPLLAKREKKIFSLIEKEFKEVKLAVWTTNIINEFMLHQPIKFLTIVEVEKEAIESAFYLLKDNGIANVFLQPGQKEIQRYVYESEDSIVIQPLITKSPLQQIEEFSTVTLEKLLVDIFSNKKLFNAYQGSEFVFIINTAYQKYSIDFTKLLSYARRRGKDQEFIEFLSQETDVPKSVLNEK